MIVSVYCLERVSKYSEEEPRWSGRLLELRRQNWEFGEQRWLEARQNRAAQRDDSRDL